MSEPVKVTDIGLRSEEFKRIEKPTPGQVAYARQLARLTTYTGYLSRTDQGQMKMIMEAYIYSILNRMEINAITKLLSVRERVNTPNVTMKAAEELEAHLFQTQMIDKILITETAVIPEEALSGEEERQESGAGTTSTAEPGSGIGDSTA